MYLIRFVAALMLAVLIVLAGVTLEKHNLALRQRIYAQREQLRRAEEEQARHRLRISELSAPGRILEQLNHAQGSSSREPQRSVSPSRRRS